MNANRIRLINAARKALFQRAQLKRSTQNMRSNFAPSALKQRAKSTAQRKVETVMESAERSLRKYSVPVGIAALAGLALAFRRPLGEAANMIANHADKAARALTEFLAEHSSKPPHPESETEQSDEPV